MNLRPCPHFEDLRRALSLGHWPAACPPQLRAHVAACNRCSQEVLLTQHLQLARAQTLAAAPSGAPSLIWWRAQARRRNAALNRAGLPLAAAFAFALAIVIAALLGLVATHWHSLPNPALWTPVPSLLDLTTAWGPTPLLAGVAVLATLAAVALYLTSDRQQS